MVSVAVFSFYFPTFAQTNVFDFTTAIGNGSFTLDLNVLTLSSVSSNTATYTDPVDVLTFNGTNYSNPSFTVINDLHLLNQNDDGFIVQAGSNGTTNPPDVMIIALGNGAIINGTAVPDLFTVLSSYASFYTSGGVYPDPHINFQYDSSSSLVSGDIYSFQLVPEPTTMTLSLLVAIGIGLWHFYVRRVCASHKRLG